MMDYLKISRTYGELGIKSTPAVMRIRSTNPRFKMKKKPPEMVVNRQPARLVIDKKQAYADRGNKTVMQLTDDFAKWASDVCTEAIERISAEGTAIMKAGKNRGEIIRQILIQKMRDRPTTIDVKIADGPSVRWEAGYLEIDWIIHQPEIEWEVNSRVNIEVEPHDVKIYVRKLPTLEIEVVKKDKKRKHKLNRKI